MTPDLITSLAFNIILLSLLVYVTRKYNIARDHAERWERNYDTAIKELNRLREIYSEMLARTQMVGRINRGYIHPTGSLKIREGAGKYKDRLRSDNEHTYYPDDQPDLGIKIRSVIFDDPK